MPITCPDCKTTYQVDNSQIGEKGRSVKCIKCENVWHAYQDRPVERLSEFSDGQSSTWQSNTTQPLPSPADQTAGMQIAGPKTSQISQQVEEVSANVNPPEIETPLPQSTDDGLTQDIQNSGQTTVIETENAVQQTQSFEDEDVSAVSDEPAMRSISDEGAEIISNVSQAMMAIEKSDDFNTKKVGIGPIIRTEIKVKKNTHTRENVFGVSVFVLILGILFSAFAFREKIVQTVPEMATIYKSFGLGVNLRGLVFKDISTVNDFENGVGVLIVSGSIQNVARTASELPTVRLALRNDRGQEIYAWTYQPTVKKLGIDESVSFTTRVVSPPDSASDIKLRFIGNTDSIDNF